MEELMLSSQHLLSVYSMYIALTWSMGIKR